MKLREFSSVHTQKQKENLIRGLAEKEKLSLLREQEQSILLNWDSCEIETEKRLRKHFSTLNEQIMYNDELLSFANWTFEKYTYGNRTQDKIFQWDIFYCDLGHNVGNEKNKTRPVLIIQKTKGYLQAKTLIIAPITIGDRFDKVYKHEVVIKDTFYNKIKGKVDLSHLRAIDRARMDERHKDRLLKPQEYKDRFGENTPMYTQTKIKSALKTLFSIDI